MLYRKLKEELKINLQERWNDLKVQGYDNETAYKMTIDSIGDISEAVRSVAGKTKEVKQMVNNNLSLMQLEGSDLRGIWIHDGKFNYSALQGTDFGNSDLTNSSFLCSDLTDVKFDGTNLTGAKITMSSLNGASFERCILNPTHFHTSDLSGVRLENLTLDGTSSLISACCSATYAVFTICRAMYAAKYGRQASKNYALSWAKKRFPKGHRY